MKRIDTATAAFDKFGPGKNGFQNGDPLVGTPPTQLDADWFDGFQEAPARVVENIGWALDPADHDQLYKAIRKIAQDITDAAGRDADTLDGRDSTYFATAADLLAHIQDRSNPHAVTPAQIGAAPIDSPQFSGNPTAPTPPTADNDSSVATTAFVQAAIAAALQGSVGGGFTQSFADNGWCRMPNGLILQWGRLAAIRSEGSGPNVTFPISFPNNCLGVATMDWNRNASAQWIYVDCFVQLVSISPSAFATFVQNPGSDRNHWDGFFWIAVGY